MCVEDSSLRFDGLTFDLRYEQARRADAHLVLRDMHGRERRTEEFSERHVVEPHERKLLGTLEPRLARRPQRPQSEEVVRAEDRRRRLPPEPDPARGAAA